MRRTQYGLRVKLTYYWNSMWMGLCVSSEIGYYEQRVKRIFNWNKEFER